MATKFNKNWQKDKIKLEFVFLFLILHNWPFKKRIGMVRNRLR